MSHFLLAFEEIDRDSSGEITIEELKNYMQEQNYEDKFAEKFLNLFDMNGDGAITIEEYCQALGIVRKKERKMSRLAAMGSLPPCNMVIIAADMIEDMQDIAVETARESLSKFILEQDRAAHMKRTFDLRFDRAWHAIVGRGPFGSFISNTANGLFHFQLDSIAFLLWKTPDY